MKSRLKLLSVVVGVNVFQKVTTSSLCSVVVGVNVFQKVTTSSLCPVVVGVIMMCGSSYAQTAAKPHRILFILNGSASMGESWQGQAVKHKLASQFITGLAEEMYNHNDDILFSMRAYGHLFPVSYNICKDSRTEVRFSKENHFQLGLRLQDIKPIGKGALNYAFSEAMANELADTARYQYSIIVMSDTSRQCQADNCLPAGKFYRKYLVEFGGATPGNCYDSVFSGEPAGYRSAIDYIISQYPAKGKEIIAAQPVVGDTIRIPIYIQKASTKPGVPAGAVADSGVAVIYNTSQLYTIVLYAQEGSGFRKLEEVFFSGAASKAIVLKPGRYKAAFVANGVEHARIFNIEKGGVAEVRVE